MHDNARDAAERLGYAWPDDPEKQRTILVLIAMSAVHWKERAVAVESECFEKVSRERLYQHQRDRIQSLSRRLRNTRKALQDFMKYQTAVAREMVAESMAIRDKAIRARNHTQ